VSGQPLTSGQVREDLAEGARREDLDAVGQCGLLGVGRRHDDLAMSGAGRGQHRRQHSTDPAHRPVEAELT
jgi:hypothetical protein